MRINTRLMSALAAGATAALLAACTSSGAGLDDGNDGGEGAGSVEVLLPQPAGLPFTPLIVGQEMGFFEDAGLEVTYSAADGSGYLSQQIVAGNVDFALMGAADAVVTFSKRNDVRVIFCNSVNNAIRIVARADTGIEDMAGLKGHALGYTEPGGGEVQIVKAALADAGLFENEDVTLVPVGAAGPQSLAALQDDTIQAYSSSFPDIAALAAEGIEWVDIAPEKYSNIPGACMVTTEEVLGTEQGLSQATALTKGWVDAQYYAIENPDEAFESVCGAIESACENESAARALYAESMDLIVPPEGQRPGELRLSSWETLVEVLSSSGTVETGLDVSPLIGGDNVEAVVSAAYADVDAD